MAKPPSDVSPSELFQKLLERPAPSMVFPFPRLDDSGEPMFDVRVFVLREEQLEMCKVRARRWVTERAKEGADVAKFIDEQMMGDRVAKEIVAESVHENRQIGQTGHWVRLFRNAEDVGKLTSDEIERLFSSYLCVQLRFGPTPEMFESDEEVNQWVSRLEDAARRPFWSSLLSSHQRDELLGRLVERASCTSTALSTSQPGSLPGCLESNRENWLIGTGSSTVPAAESTVSQAEVFTAEQAMAAASALRRASRATE